jgi:hypothetical protein
MKSIVLAATAAAAFGLATVGPLAPARATAASACQSADAVKVEAEAGTARHGGTAIRLDGIEAAGFVDYLNTRVGEPTDYRGESVIIGLYPDLGYALVGFVVHGCADTQLVKIDPESFLRAYKAARGTRV